MAEVDGFVALVPMKGHSERIPRKNLKPLGGRPLCHWILGTLASVDAISRILVDTDSREIARVVRGGFDQVTVLERPERLRGDDVSVNRIIRHDVRQVPDAELFVQTHATNPFLRGPTLRRALDRFLAPGSHDSLLAVTRHQARFYDADGAPVNHDPRGPLERTQDLPPLYEDNSNLYVFSRRSLAATGRRVGERPIFFEMDALEAIDLDEPSDWRLAQLLMREQRLEQGAETP